MSGFLDAGVEHPEPYAFIQWKGTDACFDFYCDCDGFNHFNGDFAYVVKCAECGQEWEMPCILFPRKRGEATHEGHEARLMEGIDDY